MLWPWTVFTRASSKGTDSGTRFSQKGTHTGTTGHNWAVGTARADLASSVSHGLMGSRVHGLTGSRLRFHNALPWRVSPPCGAVGGGLLAVYCLWPSTLYHRNGEKCTAFDASEPAHDREKWNGLVCQVAGSPVYSWMQRHTKYRKYIDQIGSHYRLVPFIKYHEIQ